MALRGSIPETTDKRLKMLMFGEAGAGKTTCSIQFPKPYIIDTEKGAENDQYIKKIQERGGAYWSCNDFDEIMNEVRSLLTEKHEYCTVIIDPVTTIHDSLLDKKEQEVGSDFGRHYGAAKKEFKRLCNLLVRLDMNVVLTSHHKNLYGTGTMQVSGKTFDGPKGLDYLFDLVLEIQVRGSERWANVHKSRFENIAVNEAFEFSYDTLAKKYGREVLEREAVALVLATPDQIEKVDLLFSRLPNGDYLRSAWLEKKSAGSVEEITQADMDKAIEYLSKQVLENTDKVKGIK